MDDFISILSYLWGVLLLPLGWLWSQNVSNRKALSDYTKDLHEKVDQNYKEFNAHKVDAARDYITEDKINSKIQRSEDNVLRAVQALDGKVDHIEKKLDRLIEAHTDHGHD